jgi:Na+-transporting NADH:ubiquinone oxidoreductase subunit NqrF
MAAKSEPSTSSKCNGEASCDQCDCPHCTETKRQQERYAQWQRHANERIGQL